MRKFPWEKETKTESMGTFSPGFICFCTTNNFKYYDVINFRQTQWKGTHYGCDVDNVAQKMGQLDAKIHIKQVHFQVIYELIVEVFRNDLFFLHYSMHKQCSLLGVIKAVKLRALHSIRYILFIWTIRFLLFLCTCSFFY